MPSVNGVVVHIAIVAGLAFDILHSSARTTSQSKCAAPETHK
jgi:hypothetical protein